MSLDTYFASLTRSTFLANEFIGEVVPAPEIPEAARPDGYGLTMIADAEGFSPTYATLHSREEGDEAAELMLIYSTMRRFKTRKGTFIHRPEYGEPLDALLNADFSLQELPFIEAELSGEAAEDERVANAKTVVTFSDDAIDRTVFIHVTLEPYVGREFQFTIASSKVRMTLYEEARPT